MIDLQQYLAKCPYCKDEYHMRVMVTVGEHFIDERVVICMKCGLIFLNPREANLEDFYASDAYSKLIRDGETPSDDIIDRAEHLSAMRIKLISKYLPKSGLHVDIGSGAGYLLKEIRDNTELEVLGIEATPGFAEWSMEEHNTNVVVDLFPCDIEVDNLASISLIHVIEHLPKPFVALRKIYDLLPLGGIFIIEFPDVLRALDTRKDEDGKSTFEAQTYFQKSHIYDFYLKFLGRFLMELGFDIKGTILWDFFPLNKNVLLILEKTGISYEVEDKWSPMDVVKFIGEVVGDEPVRPEVS